MFNNGNGSNGHSGIGRWWQALKRYGDSDAELDLAPYRRLAVQLHYGLPRAGEVSRSVLVVTPNESRYWAEGCVTLASSMAEELHRPVLLVDADDSGEVGRMIESPSSSGLADFLSDPRRPLHKLALPTSQKNLSFLPAGAGRDAAFSAAPENAKELLTQSGQQWDFVLVAGGPVLKNSMTLAMAPYVGRVLLLVIEDRTHLEDIDAAHYALQQCNAQNVSLVLAPLNGSLR